MHTEGGLGGNSWDMTGDRADALELGFDHRATKPISADAAEVESAEWRQFAQGHIFGVPAIRQTSSHFAGEYSEIVSMNHCFSVANRLC